MMNISMLRRRDAVAAVVCLVGAVLALAFCLMHADARHSWSEALAAGGKVKTRDLVSTTFWWAGIGTGGVMLVAALWSGLAAVGKVPGWIGPREVKPLLPPPAKIGHNFWWVLLALLVVATALRVPRLGLSFYNDESHSYVRLIAGEWKNYGGEKERFRRPKWKETAFRNSTGNNGFLYSMLARACHDTWRKASGAADGEVREWPVRIPSMIASLVSIALIALVLRAAGVPWAGLLAAAVLVFHPWHVRYGSEGRGYALMMACLAASYFFLLRGMQTGHWKHWVAHGLALFAAFWTYPGALFAILDGQLALGALLVWMVWRPATRSKAIPHFVRWAGGGVVAVLCAAFFLAPGLIQLQEALRGNPAMVGKVLPGWWVDTLSYLGVGCGWRPTTSGNPVNPVAADMLIRQVGAWAMGVGFVFGMVAAYRQRVTWMLSLLVVIQFLSLGVLYLRSVAYGNVLLWWYALPVLPGIVMVIGMSARLPWSGWGRYARFVPVVLGLFGMFTVLPTILTHGKSDGRGIVRAARGGDYPHYDFAPITLTLWSDAVTYDPPIRWLDDEKMLEKEMARSLREGRALYVLTAHETKAWRGYSSIMKRLTESGEFEQVVRLWGLESSVHDNALYRWKGRLLPAHEEKTLPIGSGTGGGS